MWTATRKFSNLLRPLVAVPARRLHSSAPRVSSASGGVNTFNADAGKLGTKLYHSVNLAILAGIPVAFATSPSALTMPLDVLLGLAMPLHGHIGMNYVITDYVPRASRGPARALTLAASLLAAAGLLKLNLSGAGLTETLKATWRAPQKKSNDKEEAGSSEDTQTTSNTSAV